MNVQRRDYLDKQAANDQVVVVVFLRGGADGLTLVPPRQDDLYTKLRPTLAVSSSDMIAVDDTFALHAELRPLMRWYEAGEMSVLHGVGSADTSRSHFAAQDFMEHGGQRGSGWLARYLRAQSDTPTSLCAVAIGTTMPESLRGAPGGAVIQSIHDFALGEGGDEAALTEDLAQLYSQEAGPLATAARDTLEAARRLRTLRAAGDDPPAGVTYPQNDFGRGLREIARLIKADVGLVASTIDLGGWDTHFGQNALIGELMRTLAGGIDAFLKDLGTERNRTSVVVMTEFGRRVAENTSLGTDHGLASTMFTIGPAAEGSGVHSRWRELASVDLEGPGDVAVGIDYRDVLAGVLRRAAPWVDRTAVFPEGGGALRPA